MTTLSSREVNQEFGRAKKASASGPVFITDRGKPSHVLIEIEAFRRLNEPKESVAEGLACDDTVNLENYIPGRSFPTRKVIFD
jgi:prevent-host-death family protein